MRSTKKTNGKGLEKQKKEKRWEVATWRRALIRLSDHSAITASLVDTGNSRRLFKKALNFIKTWPRDKD